MLSRNANFILSFLFLTVSTGAFLWAIFAFHKRTVAGDIATFAGRGFRWVTIRDNCIISMTPLGMIMRSIFSEWTIPYAAISTIGRVSHGTFAGWFYISAKDGKDFHFFLRKADEERCFDILRSHGVSLPSTT